MDHCFASCLVLVSIAFACTPAAREPAANTALAPDANAAAAASERAAATPLARERRLEPFIGHGAGIRRVDASETLSYAESLDRE